MEIVIRQLVVAPLELLGATGIIYFALPEAGNPGFFVVLGVFIASFSAALWSDAPGGLDVFEWFFISAMPQEIRVFARRGHRPMTEGSRFDHR